MNTLKKLFLFIFCLTASCAYGSEHESRLKQDLYERRQTQYVVIKVRDISGFVLLGTALSCVATVTGMTLSIICLPIGLIILVPAAIASVLFSLCSTAALPMFSATLLYGMYNKYQIEKIRDELDRYAYDYAS